ncbi:MAG: SDR family oxidoreductase [Elusimicrobiota bacterium]|jgi:3-oxoacyl-[acyl-carrier protein] reductase
MDRTVLITGGSGAVGSALVRRFAADGWKTAFTYRSNIASAEKLEKETLASGFKAELCDQIQVQAAVAAILEKFGRIDVLINNAGRTQVMPFALIEEDDWDEVIAANLKSMFLMTREVVREMIRRKAGVIINIGSLAGHRLLEVPVHYATAKAGVSGFTLSLAKELSRYGIRVNEVVPGLLSEGVGRLVPEKEMTEYVQYCTAGRPGTPQEVAEVVSFLASDKAGYINAQSVFVDGGI